MLVASIWSFYLMGTEFQFGMTKEFWRWKELMVAPQCACTGWPWTSYLRVVRRADVRRCVFYRTARSGE